MHLNEPRGERKEARNILRDAVMLIPNFLKLLYRLFRDSRVPLAEKAFLTGAIVYVISPLDLIPDVLPFIGQVDDLYLVALTMLRLLGRAPVAALEEHWEGPGDIAGVVNMILRAAQFVLPKRIQHILLGRVEIAPKMIKGGVVASPAVPTEHKVYPKEWLENNSAKSSRVGSHRVIPFWQDCRKGNLNL